MTPENTKITPEMAMEELGIKSSQYYDLIKKLGIKAGREHGKAYLTEEQMQKLREYKQPQNALATVEESSEISFDNLPEESQPEGDEVDDLIRSAQELKAQQLVMPDLIKLYLSSGMSEDDLPPDLQEKVRAARRAANPTGESAKAIAQNLLAQYQSRQK